jgi:hypothetical protein
MVTSNPTIPEGNVKGGEGEREREREKERT